MNKEWKKLLLTIATLPLVDQRWILSQLTEQQRQRFISLQGPALLDHARTFRKVSSLLPPEIPLAPLPQRCKELTQQEPLLIAIILEQGKFTWENTFLDSLPHAPTIKEAMATITPELKTATKQLVLQQWQNQLSFDEHLMVDHG